MILDPRLRCLPAYAIAGPSRPTIDTRTAHTSCPDDLTAGYASRRSWRRCMRRLVLPWTCIALARDRQSTTYHVAIAITWQHVLKFGWHFVWWRSLAEPGRDTVHAYPLAMTCTECCVCFVISCVMAFCQRGSLRAVCRTGPPASDS